MTLRYLGERIERIKIMEEDVCCGNCEHFYQHYVRYESGQYSGYMPTNCGHCDYPRMKDRRAEQQCRHFKRRRIASAEEILMFLAECAAKKE